MSELNLILNGNFDKNAIKNVHCRLNEHIKVSEPNYLLEESADPVLISVIELIGNLSAWHALAVPATAYVTQLAVRTADATVEHLKSMFRDKNSNPIVDAATALATFADSVDGKVEVNFIIENAGNPIGVAKTRNAHDPENLARALSFLVANAEQLSKATQSVIDELNRPPPGGVRAELQENGSWLITWLNPDTDEPCEKEVTFRLNSNDSIDD